MKITMNHENISRVATNVFFHRGDLTSYQELIIDIPEKATLVVEGDVHANGSIIVKGGNLTAERNISSNGSIICDGELRAQEGSISALTGIKSGELIVAETDVCCIEGDIVTPAMHCNTFSCKNYDALEGCVELTLQMSEEDINRWIDETVAEMSAEIIAQ